MREVEYAKSCTGTSHQNPDRAINNDDFDHLVEFYSKEATLVVKPGTSAKGKEEIRRAFVAIADYFNHSLIVNQEKMAIIEKRMIQHWLWQKPSLVPIKRTITNSLWKEPRQMDLKRIPRVHGAASSTTLMVLKSLGIKVISESCLIRWLFNHSLWGNVNWLCATAINYMDRENLSVAGSTLQQELGLTATQLGLLFSAFYFIFNKIVVKRDNLSQIIMKYRPMRNKINV